jgi:hypothetical protein
LDHAKRVFGYLAKMKHAIIRVRTEEDWTYSVYGSFRGHVIAAKTIGFYHANGVWMIPADILSKHWGSQQQVWKFLRPLLFWPGDTIDILDLENVKIMD